jgi:hypothetical protein
VRASAPPPAPSQVIHHEAHATPASIEGGNDTRIDYGREIELPGLQPAARASEPVAPAPVPAAVPGSSMMMQVPAGLRAAAAAASAPARSAGSASVIAPSPVAPAPVAATPAPTPAPVAAAPAAPANGSGQQSTRLVVPVTISKGGTYEIVIKLQVEDEG